MLERQLIALGERSIGQCRQRTTAFCIEAWLGDSQAANMRFWYLLTASIQGRSYLSACLRSYAWLVIPMRKENMVSERPISNQDATLRTPPNGPSGIVGQDGQGYDTSDEEQDKPREKATHPVNSNRAWHCTECSSSLTCAFASEVSTKAGRRLNLLSEYNSDTAADDHHLEKLLNDDCQSKERLWTEKMLAHSTKDGIGSCQFYAKPEEASGKDNAQPTS